VACDESEGHPGNYLSARRPISPQRVKGAPPTKSKEKMAMPFRSGGATLGTWISRRFREVIYQSSAVVSVLLVIVPTFAAGQTVSSSSPQVQRVIIDSGKLRKLLDEVKSYGYVDVVVTQDVSSAYALEGYSKPQTTQRGMVYDVHISSGSDTYVEALIAHELFHASLRHERFAFNPATIVSGSELSANEIKVMEFRIEALGNCYQDAEIDRRMAKLGFNPKLLQDDAKSTLIAEANTLPNTSVYKQYVSLIMYCVSIRLRNFGMDEIYAPYKPWYPNLSQDVRTITETVGPEACDTGEACFKKLLALRKAVGLEGEVKFTNPTTKRKE
jgi:hypothetical protein